VYFDTTLLRQSSRKNRQSKRIQNTFSNAILIILLMDGILSLLRLLILLSQK